LTLGKRKGPGPNARSESLRESFSPAGARFVQVYGSAGFGLDHSTAAVRLRKRRRPGASLPPLSSAHETMRLPRLSVEWHWR